MQMIFLGIIMFFKFFGQNGPKMRFFKHYQISMHGTFLIFFMKLQQHDDSRLTQMTFFGKILQRGFWTKRGPK